MPKSYLLHLARVRIFASLMCLCPALLLLSCSQTPSTKQRQDIVVIPGLNPNQSNRYEQEKKRLLAREVDVDFTTLRQTFTSTEAYEPWDTREHEASLAMFNALEDGDFTLCLQFSDAILTLNYTSLGGHFGAYTCHNALEHFDQSAFHRYVITGLMHSIEASGNGQSATTAYKTISASEMRSFLQVRGQLMYRQEYTPLGAKQIDKIFAIDSETEEHIEVYFDNSAALMPGIKVDLR